MPMLFVVPLLSLLFVLLPACAPLPFEEKTEDAPTLRRKAEEAKEGNRWDEAISLNRQVLALDPDDADAWGNLGLALVLRGRQDEAEEAWRRALPIYTRKGDEKGRGTVLVNLGTVARGRGRYVEAEGLFQESLAISRRIGDERGVAFALFHLAHLKRVQDQRGQAIQYAREALEIARRIGSPLAAQAERLLQQLEGR